LERKEKEAEMKTRMIMLIVLVVLLALPVALHAQAMTPEEVVVAMIAAEEAGDLEAQIALFADDAVYALLPPSPDMPEPIVGKDAIRARREGLAAAGAEGSTEITGVDGNTVTTLSRYIDDDLRSMGLEYIEGVEEYVIEDGKITSYTWTMTDESLAALMAAMPPETMPESGGGHLPIHAVVMALGGLAVTGGFGLEFLRRRSRWV
jgi:ketosteroid isomerase-like protein